MRNLNAFLLMYASLVSSTVFLLSLLSTERIDLYLLLFVMEFFIASELTSPFSPNQYRRSNILAIALLLIFAGIVVERMIEILR